VTLVSLLVDEDVLSVFAGAYGALGAREFVGDSS